MLGLRTQDSEGSLTVAEDLEFDAPAWEIVPPEQGTKVAGRHRGRAVFRVTYCNRGKVDKDRVDLQG